MVGEVRLGDDMEAQLGRLKMPHTVTMPPQVRGCGDGWVGSRYQPQGPAQASGVVDLARGWGIDGGFPLWV